LAEPIVQFQLPLRAVTKFSVKSSPFALCSSGAVLILDGDINAELKRRTYQDTTTGRSEQAGVCRAYLAYNAGEVQ